MLAGFMHLPDNDFDLCVVRSRKTNSAERGIAGTLVTIIFLPMPRSMAAENAHCEERSMPGNEFEKPDTGNGILQGVRHHAGPQALPQVRQYAEEHTKETNGNHHARSLVSVCQSKKDS